MDFLQRTFRSLLRCFVCTALAIAPGCCPAADHVTNVGSVSGWCWCRERNCCPKERTQYDSDDSIPMSKLENMNGGRYGVGAYVCDDSTAQIGSLELSFDCGDHSELNASGFTPMY